jgi:hypothetical protein
MNGTRFRHGIFVSYSHADSDWLARLEIHLAPYTRGEHLDLWADTRIAPGAKWAEEIDRAIDQARVAVCLVSPDFLASQFVTRVELPKIFRRSGPDLTILWIPIRPSAYEVTPFNDFQAVVDPRRPLSTLPRPKQEEAMVVIAKRIAAAVDINVVGNALSIIDEFEPQVKAFVAGAPEPETAPQHSWRAEQVEASIQLVEPGGTWELITASDFEKLDEDAQKLIRAYERTMKDLFERWTELKPKRVAQDPAIRREARELSDDVRRDLCEELNGLLRFIESMGKSLQDHYHSVRYICSQPSV